MDDKKVDVQHLIEQYRIYVNSAEKISDRRATANAFFITVNSFILLLGTFFIDNSFAESLNNYQYTMIFLLQVIIVFTWGMLIRSYRNLNTAKFKVIGEIEKYLPMSPFWSMEWNELGQGKNYRKYIPLTIVETLVPGIFLIIYIALYLIQVFL